MKRILTFCYFVFFVAIFIVLRILSHLEKGVPLWSIIFSVTILSLVAISILLYGLSYKPKRFTWFWKVIPFTLLAHYAIGWYFLGWNPVDTNESLLLLIIGTCLMFAVFFAAFYLSFKFGYSKSLPAAKSSPKFIAFIFVITVLCTTIRYLPNIEDIVNIKVDYVAKLNEISRPANYDPNDNAAPYYQKAFELCVNQPEQLNNSDIKVWPEDLPQEKQIVLQNWVSANSGALKQLELGTQKPYYWPEYQGNSMFDIALPSLAEARKLMCAVYSRAKLNAAEGNFKGAFSDLLVCYRFGSHLTGTKTLIEQLAGIAISANAVLNGLEILDKTKPNPDSLKDFQFQLKLLSERQIYIIDFTAEKLLAYDGIQMTFTDDGKGGGYVPKVGIDQIKNPPEPLKFLFSDLTEEQKRGWDKLERRQTTELTDEIFEYFNQVRHKTPAQLHNEGKDLEKVIEEITKDNPFVNMLMPAVGRVIDISYRGQAVTNALITTLAILRYKADKSQLPKNLDQLVENGYLKGLPVDPYSDSPLAYKQIGDDFILYSFGVDFDDDGGTPSKWGEGEQGGDQVFWPVSRKQE